MTKAQPVKALCRLPNTKIIVSDLKVFNYPCHLGRTASDLLIFTDPVNKTVEFLDVAGGFMSAISLATIVSD